MDQSAAASTSARARSLSLLKRTGTFTAEAAVSPLTAAEAQGLTEVYVGSPMVTATHLRGPRQERIDAQLATQATQITAPTEAVKNLTEELAKMAKETNEAVPPAQGTPASAS